MIDGYFLKFTLLTVGSDGKNCHVYVLASTIRGFRECDGLTKHTMIEREIPGLSASITCLSVRETLDECLAKLEQIPMMSECVVARLRAVELELGHIEDSLEARAKDYDTEAKDTILNIHNCRLHLEQCMDGCRVPYKFQALKED